MTHLTHAHIHTGLELWAIFMSGLALSVLKRANLSAGSHLEYFKREWVSLAIRVFLASAILSYWVHHPDAMTRLLAWVGVTVNFTLEPEHSTAGVFGFFSDSLLDWLAAKFSIFRKTMQ